MESFLREPSRLAAEQQRLLSDMVGVSVKHYPVFIDATETCSDVLSSVAQDMQTVGRLQSEEEELHTCLKGLVDKGLEWKKGRQQLLILRSSQELIRDVFELPAILENCLRNELYYEAVTLHDKAEEMVTAAPHVPVVRMIAKDVEATMHKHLPQLIAKLSTALSPAQCLKITRFITRLKLMSNRDLRKLFLARRLVYLQSLLRDSQRSVFTYLNRVCNVLGVNLPAVITEYNSSFEGSDKTLSKIDCDYDTPACGILGAWLNNVVETYLSTIETNLPLITSGGELKQLFEQALQCGKQLSQKGVDVRPVLQRLFSQRILALWNGGLDAGYTSFRLCLSNHVWMKHASHGREHKYDRVGGSVAPPQVLRQYLPLGYLCNGVLAAFNEFRRCALVALTPQVLHTLSELLQKCVEDVASVYTNQSLDAAELEGYLAFVKVMTDDLLPYLSRACDIMLSTSRGVAARDIAAPLLDIYREHVKPAAVPSAPKPAEGEGAKPAPQQQQQQQQQGEERAAEGASPTQAPIEAGGAVQPNGQLPPAPTPVQTPAEHQIEENTRPA